MADSDVVYVGLWRNWDKGLWAGPTITIPARYGAVLVVVLAMYIRFCGDHLWRIASFFIHQRRTTREPRDGLFHQEQVLLRNGNSPEVMLWALSQMYWRWRAKVSWPWIRFAKLALPMTGYLASLAAAGLLSSQLLNLGDEVLASSTVCGWLPDSGSALSAFVINSNTTANIKDDSLYVEGRLASEKSLEYANACYEERTVAYSSLCSAYVRQRLIPTVNLTAPCPFANNTCEMGTAVAMDSGLLDSSQDLGVNTPPDQRIQVRKVTTCATTPFDRYASGWTTVQQNGTNLTGSADIERTSRYSWMTYNIFDDGFSDSYLVSVANDSALFLNPGYSTWNLPLYDGDPLQTGLPPNYPLKPELLTSDADSIYILIQNLAVYAAPVTDLLFRASSQVDQRGYPNGTLFDIPNAWYPDRVLSVLGCTEQYQFCAGAGRCTTLAGIYALQANSSAIAALGLTEAEAAVYSVVWKAAWSTQAAFIVEFLKERTFQAVRFRRDFAVSAPVNADQWIREAENLHNISMAVLQRRVVEYGSPPNVTVRPGISSRQFIVPPATTEEQNLCGNIKVRSSVYASFSLASLLIVLGGGCLIVIANSVLTETVFWMRRRCGDPRHSERGRAAEDRTQAWINAHTFQLHRALLQSHGIGPWDVTNSSIPVLKDWGTAFVRVDTSDAAAQWYQIPEEEEGYSKAKIMKE